MQKQACLTKQSILMMAYTYYETDPRVIRAAEAARDGQFHVDVLALRRVGQPAIETIRGVRVFRIQSRYRGSSLLRYAWEYAKFFVRCAVLSARLFGDRRYRLVHVHNMPDALVFAACIPKLFGAKIILDIHDPMPETYESKFRRFGSGMLHKLLLIQEVMSVAFTDKTITVSDPVRDGILLKRRYRPETISVIANFADGELFRPNIYPSLDGVIRFVFHGTILERYGLRTLVESVAKVRRRERICIRVIGEGDFSSTLRELILKYGVSDSIEFLNQAYPLHEIPKMLSDCHVGLVPLDIGISAVGNFALPLKLIEYTCLGLPSICVRNAAIAYYFSSDECMFFQSGDAAALAEWIDRVAENPGTLTDFRKKLEPVRERLLWSREKEKYLALMHDLACEKDSRISPGGRIHV
jgi:glycosyltransferase involved in cell wall biosynthesis